MDRISLAHMHCKISSLNMFLNNKRSLLLLKQNSRVQSNIDIVLN